MLGVFVVIIMLFGITAYLLEENHRAGLDENLCDVEKFDSKERYEQGWTL